ncbi:cytochrome c-type biogenesis protein [Undibacterium sp. Di27W]|uniref:cytochrome c-type biogenesis protein n=1 Tax=Undibacterium sp. Di27W TaxID=3413036 RepID=UPI003BEFE888
MNPFFKKSIQWALSLTLILTTVFSQAETLSIDQRVQKLSEELRCLVCQNQTLADSHAELAVNLKQQIREKFQQGQNEKEITDFLVARYGDFVHYRPPFNYQTALLWIGPYLLLLAALIFLFARVKVISGTDEAVETAISRRHLSDPLL